MSATRIVTVIVGLLATAQAAGAGDLPIFLGAPVEPTAGLVLPAEGTSLPDAGPSFRIGGMVRIESRGGRSPSPSRGDLLAPNGTTLNGTVANGPLTRMRHALRLSSRLDLDARIPTDYGPLHGYVSVRPR